MACKTTLKYSTQGASYLRITYQQALTRTFVSASNNYGNVTLSVSNTKKRKPFPVLDTVIDSSASTFGRNVKAFDRMEQIYRQAEAVSLAGGGQKSYDRHVNKHGKMMLVDRVSSLVDNIDECLELSLIAGVGMEYGHVPRANTMSVIGKVNGHYCMISGHDGSFKGGSIYPITTKKTFRTQDISEQNRLPSLLLVDSAGGFLPLQDQIFNSGGRAFYNQAVMGSKGITNIAIVCGSCTAGGAYVPSMADEAIMVHRIGTLFLGGPPLVQAALGEIMTAEELGGATVHCKVSGGTDYFAHTEVEALEKCRDIVASLNLKCNEDLDIPDFDEPLYDAEEITGLIPPCDEHNTLDMYPIISRLVDGSRFQEFKKLYGTSLITGFAHIQGHLVGILANQQGEISQDEGAKGTHFVQMCNERDIPLIFLQNALGEPEVTSVDEAVSVAKQIKSRATMLAAVSCATVPKLTVLVGDGFGTSHYIMGGGAVEPNFLFAWPNARVAIMEPLQLAQKVAQEMHNSGSEVDSDHLTKLVETITKKSSAIYGATQMHNDGIIMPNETRKVLSQCLAICKAYRTPPETRYPILRM